MHILDYAAVAIICLAGIYFLGLGVSAFILPARTASFLGSFAGSAFAHYLEMSLRLVVGFALLRFAPQMPISIAFTVFGWLLVGTTACLLLIPWQWHHKFAQRTVPQVLQYLKLVAAVSIALGIAFLTAAVHALIYPNAS